jgi:hypothetical protein
MQGLADRLRDEGLHLQTLLDAEQASAPLEFTRDTGVEADEWLGGSSQLSPAPGRHGSRDFYQAQPRGQLVSSRRFRWGLVRVR